MSNGHYIWNEGTTQNTRRKQPLTEKNFDVDERHFEVLVKYVSEYAAQISYFNQENQTEQTWKSLIDIDEIVVLAKLRLLDIGGIENQYYQYLADASNKQNTADIRQEAAADSLKVTKELFSILSNWYSVLKKIPSEAVHYPILKEWNAALKELKKTQEQQSFNLSSFLEEYNGLPEDKKSGALKKLDYFFKQLIKTAFFLNSKYEKFLSLSKRHQSHLPHHGLIFAFLELLEYAQKSINTFHQRHLDYYYGEQLHLRPRLAKPDLVTLQFELEDGFKDCYIPERTAFLAGQDENGNDLVYKTTEPLLVEKSKIASLKGIFLSIILTLNNRSHVNYIRVADYKKKDDDSPWSILNIKKQSYGSHQYHPKIGFAISSPELMLREGDRTITIQFESLTRTSLKTLKPKYTIGEQSPGDMKLADLLEKMENKNPTVKEFFDQAWQVSNGHSTHSVSEEFISKILSPEQEDIADRPMQRYLETEQEEEGSSLTVHEWVKGLSEKYSIPSKLSFKQIVNRIIDEEDPELRKRKYRKALKNVLRIDYTSTEGWIDVEPVDVSHSNNTLKIILVLKQSFPAMETMPDSRYSDPALRFTLNADATLYGYDFIKLLQINRMHCAIKVKNVRDLVLYNQIGPVNADGPFLPFGPTPNNYSYLLIGNKEIFRKQFSKLALNIEWMDLPTEVGGFESHYQLYDQKVNNQSFKAKVSNLDNGQWSPKENRREEIRLFGDQDRLTSNVRFDLDISRLSPSFKYSWHPEELEYTGVSQRGFLKVQLSAPVHSFGHQQYPNLLSKMAMENARSATGIISNLLKKKIEMQMPNQPYTPKMDKISVEYDTEFEMNFDTNSGLKKNKNHSFFHLLPFDGIVADPAGADGIRLIPTFDCEGALLIGIKDFSAPGSLTLFFNLKETDSVQDPDPEGKGVLDWRVLHGNNWLALRPENVSLDTTDNFLHAGIVKLDVGKLGPAKPSAILDPELFWIMVSSRNNTGIMGEVIDISTHAVVAKYSASEEANVVNYKISPDTISSAVKDLPAIKSINQPRASYGGRSEEERSHFYLRVSERLRHKNRCVNPYDYERIILEAFPDISKVLCIDSYDWQTNAPATGKVLIVLVPVISDYMSANLITPSTSVKTLRKVRQLINSRTSPFVHVDVINPEYEHMRVFADVKFLSGKSAGYYLKKLNDELKAYIAPWTIDEKAEPLFQRSFPIADIQSFIQSRPYVDFVTKVSSVKVDYAHVQKKKKKEQGPYALRDTGINLEKDNETRGRYPWSIITTARLHQLNNLDIIKETPPDHAGYEDLYLNEDFVIRDEKNK
ncbi:MAG: baseplate J/gp47 family protein [Reichenbachiella sp.]|uniref:baseplate J/gp47 family protein n=1 Tax=Reichenbachiella sp. TaxID=2184521 RepID=UPI0032631873